MPYNLIFEIIPSKNQTLYIITLYHRTNTVLIQGNQKSISANKKCPILKAVLLHKREHNMSMDEAYNKTLEMSSLDTKLPENQSSKVKPTITIEITKLTLHHKSHQSK